MFLLGATLFGWLGRWHWMLDNFSHFRPQYAVGLTLLGLGFLGFKQWKSGGIFLVAAAVNAAIVVPIYLPPPSTDPTAQQSEAIQPQAVQPLTLMLRNVHTQMGDPQQVLAQITKEEPDILVLEEIGNGWVMELAELQSLYPHSSIVPREDHFGIGVWSKFPLTDVEILELGGAGVPTIFCVAETTQGRLQVVATHPLPPGSGSYAKLRNAQLAALAEHVATIQLPVVLLGDLNTTPWNHYFQKFLSQSGLQNSAQGFGVQPSWPRHLPLLQIPLDHVLHSKSITILDRQVGADSAGSDHYPVVVDLRLDAP